MEGSGPPSNTWFLGPIWAHNPNGISIGWAVFCTDDRRVIIFYNGTPLFPSKLPLSMGDLDPHLIHGSLGPLESSTTQTPFQFVHCSAAFAGLTSVTDWQTMLLGRLTIGCIYVSSTVMWLNNKRQWWTWTHMDSISGFIAKMVTMVWQLAATWCQVYIHQSDWVNSYNSSATMTALYIINIIMGSVRPHRSIRCRPLLQME